MLYLFSATAQALAAILALVTTIVLIAAQLSASLSRHLPPRLLNVESAAYMALFAVGILLPLAWMDKPTPLRARLTLTIAGICLAALIPYLASFRTRLDPLRMVDQLLAEARRRLDAIPTAEPEAARVLQSTAQTAMTERDTATLDAAVSALHRVTIEATADDVSMGVLRRLGQIRTAAAEHVSAEGSVINELTLLAMDAIRLRRDTLAENAIRQLDMAGTDALAAGRERTSRMVAGDLRIIASLAMDTRQADAANLALDSLGVLGAQGCGLHAEGMAIFVLGHLQELGRHSFARMEEAVERVLDAVANVREAAGQANLDKVFNRSNDIWRQVNERRRVPGV